MDIGSNIHSISGARVSKDALLAVLWGTVALSFCFLIFRIGLRLKVFRKLGIDDGFLIAAWVFAASNASLWQALWKELYLGVAITSGVAVTLPLDFLSELRLYLYAILGAYVLQTGILWSVKISFLFFFRGLGHNIKRQRDLWWVVMALVVATFVSCIGMYDYKCVGGPLEGIIENCLNNRTVDIEFIVLRLFTSFDILTDAAIIVVSTNILWRVRISLRKKLALIGICSLTVFIMAVAIIRVVVTTQNGNLDLTWLLLWGGVESSVAIIVASLASFRALYTHSSKAPANKSYLRSYGSNPLSPYPRSQSSNRSSTLPTLNHPRSYRSYASSRSSNTNYRPLVPFGLPGQSTDSVLLQQSGMIDRGVMGGMASKNAGRNQLSTWNSDIAGSAIAPGQETRVMETVLLRGKQVYPRNGRWADMYHSEFV